MVLRDLDLMRRFVVSVGFSGTLIVLGGCGGKATPSESAQRQPKQLERVASKRPVEQSGRVAHGDDREDAVQERTQDLVPEDSPEHRPELDHSRSHIGEYPDENSVELAAPGTKPPMPRRGADDCVEKPAVYAAKLEAQQIKLRDGALASLGARWEDREGFFIDEDVNKALDTTYEVDGKRFAVAGYGEHRIKHMKLRVAKRRKVLHRVIDDGQAHPLVVKACGTRPCPRGSGVMVRQSPIAIPLAPGETLGPPIVLHYAYWLADPQYQQEVRCPPPPPSVKGR